MPDIYDEFITYLKAQSGVTDLVGSGTAARIYPDVPRERAVMPFLVVAEVGGGESAEHLGGISGLAEGVFQVWAYDDDRGDANDLAETVRLAGVLQTYRGDMGSTATRVIASEHRDTGADLPTDRSDTKRYWCRRTYRIFYDESTS